MSSTGIAPLYLGANALCTQTECILMENPTSRTIEENWKSFKSALHQAIIKHVPTTKSKTKRHLLWIKRNIKCEIRKKDRQYRKARKSKKHEDWSAYRIKRQQLQKLLRSAHDDYIRNVIGASLLDRGNQKKFWSFVKLNRTENVGIPILSDTNGLHITNQAKAECLNTQFVSVFTSDDGKHLPDKGLSPYREMDTIQFTQPGIEILLKNIDQTKATGPDELPARILKETAKEIAGVLSVIFQQSYEEGTVPSDWLTARISAIYKKGDKANPSNYRPVSLTGITCKIMEHIVCSQIGRHLDHNNILHPNQHGFRKGLCCETQLVDTIHELAYSINQKTQTDVIFLDFSKAFDKVSHDKLLHKIRYYGIGGKTNTWISAFLCSRSQQVVVNGQTSQSAGVLSEVPQGSVLGP